MNDMSFPPNFLSDEEANNFDYMEPLGDEDDDGDDNDSLLPLEVGSSKGKPKMEGGAGGGGGGRVRKDEGPLRKGPWMQEEDEILLEYVRKHGARDWSSIRSNGLLPRTGKSCRLRWVNKLRPDLKSGCKFSPEEERIVIEMQREIGNKWAKIATYLQGRTDNDVKNFWSTRQKRLARLLKAPLPTRSSPAKKINAVPIQQVPEFRHSQGICPKIVPYDNAPSSSQSRENSFMNFPSASMQIVQIPQSLQPIEDPFMNFSHNSAKMLPMAPLRSLPPEPAETKQILPLNVPPLEPPFNNFPPLPPLDILLTAPEELLPVLEDVSFQQDSRQSTVELPIFASSGSGQQGTPNDNSNSGEFDDFFNELPDMFDYWEDPPPG